MRDASRAGLRQRKKAVRATADSRSSVFIAHGTAALCDLCCLRPQETIGRLLSRVHRTEKKLQNVHSICTSCSAIPVAEPVRCQSLDCPWFYERKKLESKAENMTAMQDLVEELIELHVDESTSDDSDISKVSRFTLLMDIYL